MRIYVCKTMLRGIIWQYYYDTDRNKFDFETKDPSGAFVNVSSSNSDAYQYISSSVDLMNEYLAKGYDYRKIVIKFSRLKNDKIEYDVSVIEDVSKISVKFLVDENNDVYLHRDGKWLIYKSKEHSEELKVILNRIDNFNDEQQMEFDF